MIPELFAVSGLQGWIHNHLHLLLDVCRRVLVVRVPSLIGPSIINGDSNWLDGLASKRMRVNDLLDGQTD